MTEPSLLDDLDGRQRRDAGAALAAQSAHTSWRLAAEHTIGQLAAFGFDFCADDVTGVVGAAPGHRNALGALFLAAARRGEIVPVGYRQSGRVEARARAVRVWRGATPTDEEPAGDRPHAYPHRHEGLADWNAGARRRAAEAGGGAP